MRAISLSLSDPWASSHGGTIRTRAFQHALRGAGFDVTSAFPPASGRNDEVTTGTGVEYVLRKFLGPAKRHFLPLPTERGGYSKDLKNAVSERAYELMLVSALSQFQYKQGFAGTVWMDFMDLWSEFAKRESGTRRGIARWTAAMQARALGHAESEHARSASIITAAGWADAETLRQRGIAADWVPTPIADDLFSPVAPRSGSDKVAGFIGNYEYWPNRHSFELIDKVWAPALEEMGWTVLIAGRKADLLRTPTSSNLEVIGEVNSLDDFYGEVSMTLAPIKLGGGIKVKVTESLAQQRPVIGTPEAFEGFPPYMSGYFSVAEDSLSIKKALRNLSFTSPDGDALAVFRQSFLDAYVLNKFDHIGDT